MLEDSEPDGDVLLELLVPVPDEPQDELPVPDAPELLLPEPESGEDGAFILESLPVPDLVDDPELPEVPLAPEVPEVSLDPDVAGVLLVPELPEVSLLGLALLPDGELVPDAPLLPVSDEPEDEPELPLFGVSVFVVVVVVVADEPDAPDVSDAPDVPDVPDELSLLACAASSLVVVVVVVCPNVCVAIPISDKKIAIGNFFMLAPSNGLNGFFRNCRR